MEPLKFASDEIPSFFKFSSSVECKNVPAVFSGCVTHWKALNNWNPANGGLDYLLERAGSQFVDAIISKSAPVFYGDIGRHQRIRLPFSSFIAYCKQRTGKSAVVTSNDAVECPELTQDMYLAQVPIMNLEDKHGVQLGVLEEDIQMLDLLGTTQLASINFWMNSTRVRSSTHYDPHHNILCVVAGRKEVFLWPPSASPYLYPYPIYGEASNHSSLNLENQDYNSFPRARNLVDYSSCVTLSEGDALFIPEGWFHQVDSEDLTIAVNFWWQSDIMSNMLEHMDGYYLRRIIRRLTDNEMELALDSSQSKSDSNKEPNDAYDPSLAALQTLVSLVHERFNQSDRTAGGERDKDAESSMNHDDVSSVLWSLEASTFQRVIQTMAANFPKTLEVLVLHLLSPIGAEVLTRKFDELDKKLSTEERDKFYHDFHSAFEDQFSAMNVVLARKEAFASKAFKGVLDKYLGPLS